MFLKATAADDFFKENLTGSTKKYPNLPPSFMHNLETSSKGTFLAGKLYITHPMFCDYRC